MSELIVPPYQKRFVLAGLIVIVLAYLFWTGSRYPALDEKAMMSGPFSWKTVSALRRNTR